MILNLMKTKVTSFAVVLLLDEPVLPQGLHKNIQMVGLGYNCNIFSFVYFFFGGGGSKNVLGQFWGVQNFGGTYLISSITHYA